jgi:hypothetical protein
MTFWELVWKCIHETLILYGWVIIVPVISNLLFNRKDRQLIKKWLKKQIFSLTSYVYRNIIKEINKVHYES